MGKAAPKGKGPSIAAPATPQLEQLPAMPAPPPLAAPKRTTEASTATSSDKAQMDMLCALLADAGTSLPESVRAFVAERQQAATQSQAKSMHRAVSDQNRAKAELQKLRASRTQYLAAWGDYLEQLSQLITQQLADQDAVLEQFNTNEIDWMSTEREATLALARMTSAEADREVVSVDDQEMEDGESRATDAAEAEARLRQQKAEHQSAGRMLQEALATAQAKAAETLNRERAGSRTPRRRAEEDTKGAQPSVPGVATSPFKLGPQEPPKDAKLSAGNKDGVQDKDKAHPP